MAKLIIHLTLFSLLILTLIGCLLKPNNINEYEIERSKQIFERNIKKELELPKFEVKDDSNNLKYLGQYLITGYCDCEECQEEWVGTTALGIPPTENWTIAVDPYMIPLGSYVWIEGHRYRAEDVGGMIFNKHIDMFMGSHEDCYLDICNGYKDVYLELSEEK